MRHLIKRAVFSWSIVVVFLAGFFNTARAGVFISGQITGTGPFTPYISTNGMGTTTSDLTMAHSLAFGTVKAGYGNTGAFTNFTTNTVITFETPFPVNPLVVSATPLWSISNYAFTATSLSNFFVIPSVLSISGTGILTDGTNADATSGNFIATFSQTGSSPNYTYTWNFTTTNFPPPALSLTGVGAGSTLSWNTNSTNFILQGTTIMSKFPAWTNLTNIAAIVGTNYVVSNVVSTNGQRYYRLKH
jgi:hypothetical protein